MSRLGFTNMRGSLRMQLCRSSLQGSHRRGHTSLPGGGRTILHSLLLLAVLRTVSWITALARFGYSRIWALSMWYTVLFPVYTFFFLRCNCDKKIPSDLQKHRDKQEVFAVLGNWQEFLMLTTAVTSCVEVLGGNLFLQSFQGHQISKY